MTLDVVVVGSSFLDLTFEGLDGLPTPGQEVLCRRLHFSPGGSAMTAIGAARLGLRAGLKSPIGGDTAGEYLLTILSDEGVEWLGPEVERSAVTAVLPWAEDRAMATFNPGLDDVQTDATDLDARAVVMPLGSGLATPDGIPVYAVTGYPEVAAGTLSFSDSLRDTHTVIANEFEALRLTGADDAQAAALKLATAAHTAVVTRGPNGALAAERETVVSAAAPPVLGRDTTGAGDLFVSAYVWADLAGQTLRERLCLATLYAGLSVRTYTPLAGAVRLDELEVAVKEYELDIDWSHDPGEKGGVR